jgi:hypothetical protein
MRDGNTKAARLIQTLCFRRASPTLAPLCGARRAQLGVSVSLWLRTSDKCAIAMATVFRQRERKDQIVTAAATSTF